MAVLKSEIKRISITASKQFLKDLDDHLQNYAVTDRGRWMIEAAKEKMAKEKEILSEINAEENDETN
jgi:metal-responsive CopG/Arc/MetJ family transcriptional regulator